MSSRPGRGAQVRIDADHRAVARGAGGSLLDNIIAKRRLEDLGIGADGDTPDGSTDSGGEALDYVLTPGGRLEGYTPGQPRPGAISSVIAATSGLSATLADRARPGAMRSVLSASSALSGGTLGGLAALSTSLRAVSGLTARLDGRGALRSEIAARSAIAADLSGPGPISSTIAASSRFGSGLFSLIAARSDLSARLGGIGALKNGETLPAPANSGDPVNSDDPVNVGGYLVASPRAKSGLSANLTGVGALSSRIAASSLLTATATGVGGVVLTPNTVVGRDGQPILLRDGSRLLLRPSLSEPILGRDGRPILLRDGTFLRGRVQPTDAILNRDGQPILLRDGSRLLRRLVPDAVEPPPVVEPPPPDPEPDPEPEQPPAVFPTGPHLLLDTSTTGNSGATRILYQDGRTARLRLIRPLYYLTAYATAEPRNNGGNNATNIFLGDNGGGRFTLVNGELYLTRDMTCEDDGTHSVQIFRAMADGTFLSLNMEVSIAIDATTANPQPTPKPALPEVFYEGFARDRGKGALTFYSMGERIRNTAQDTILLEGAERYVQPDGYVQVIGPAMQEQPHPQRLRDNNYGRGNGLFEFRARFLGPRKGDGPGPAIILWPSDNIWPGDEIDIGELFDDEEGTLYYANHWKRADNGENDQYIWPIRRDFFGPGGPVFDRSQYHTHAYLQENDRLRFFCDGRMVAEVDDHPAPDYANGGVNKTLGLANASTGTALECAWIKHTPLRLVKFPYVPSTPPGKP